MATTVTTPFFLLLILLILVNSIPIPSFSCPLHQKQSLLHFKSSLLLNINPTSDYFDPDQYDSWSPNSDCCSWNLVNCSTTKNVTELHLSEAIPLFGSVVQRSFDILTPLFQIRSLKLLDISINGLGGPIPKHGFGNLSELVHLDMGGNEFNGFIPDQIFGLTNLRYLYMNHNSFEGNLGLELGGTSFWKMTSLRVLDLGDNHFNGHLSPEVARLQYLELLALNNNSIIGNIPEEIGNLTRLRELYLADNHFSGGIPSSIANMMNLEVLDLSDNSFSMQIPSCIGRIPNMTRLVLQNNRFMGSIPSSIQNLSKLETLILHNNKVTGEIPIGLFNLSMLKSLFIGGEGNKLIWNNKAKIVPRCSLEQISIPSCGISCQIPEWISSQKDLYHLDLSRNKLDGQFPYWLAQMDLQNIVLSDNKLSGSIPPRLFESSSLEFLQLSRNSFSGELPENIANAKALRVLVLSKNNFSGEVPMSMSNMHNLTLLDLSTNKFSGDKFPIFTNLYYLDLAYNEFSGNIPTISSIETRVLCLGKNKFSGNLPRNLTKLVNLRHLSLHDNDITGYFQDVLPQSPFLQVLLLRNNSFEGFIPTTISNFANLRILDLSGNKLTGSIPLEIANLKRMIKTPELMPTFNSIFYEKPDYFYPGYDGTIHMEELTVIWKNYIQYLPSDSLDIYSLLDLSNNRISGEIPASLGNLESLIVLNISKNNISGHIPASFGNLKRIESLDLSHNKISGMIPKALAKLGELTLLDVSNNKLTGKIPLGGQMDTMNELRFFANNRGLCGMQIMIKCPEDIPPSESSEGREEAEDDEENLWIFWVGTWIGFPIGFFSSILVMGYFIEFPRTLNFL